MPARDVPRRQSVDDGSRLAFGDHIGGLVIMLKVITLAACVIGFVFLGPKALAEFRRPNPQKDTAENGRTGDKPTSGVAA